MISSQTLHPHDEFFRAAISYQAVAQEFFRFLLPKSIAEGMDFSSLTLESNNYIDEKLQECFSDLLFSCKMPACLAEVLLLVEHQSSVERLMALRVHHYLFDLLSSCRKSNTVSLLPPVHTLVVFHGGPSPYPYSLDLSDCFYDSSKMISSLHYKSLHLVDVNTLPDDELSRWSWFGPVISALKYARSSELLLHLPSILFKLNQLVEDHSAVEFEKLILEYLIRSGSLCNTDEFAYLLKYKLPERVRSAVMTIAEYFEQQGRQEVALSMVQEGMDVVFVAKMTGLNCSDVERLVEHLEDSGAKGQVSY